MVNEDRLTISINSSGELIVFSQLSPGAFIRVAANGNVIFTGNFAIAATESVTIDAAGHVIVENITGNGSITVSVAPNSNIIIEGGISAPGAVSFSTAPLIQSDSSLITPASLDGNLSLISTNTFSSSVTITPSSAASTSTDINTVIVNPQIDLSMTLPSVTEINLSTAFVPVIDSRSPALTEGKLAGQMTAESASNVYVLREFSERISLLSNDSPDLIKLNVRNKGDYTLDDNIENLVLTGKGQINVTGNASDNEITGNAKTNTLTGLAGNDTLDGGKGADTLIGGLGDDTYKVDRKNDVITEADDQGSDIVISTTSSYVLPDGASIEFFLLQGSAKTGIGNSDNNQILGNAKMNILQGGGGDDILDGYTGNDTLTGGDGADTFMFFAKLKGNVDKITDFVSGVDNIKLGTEFFNSLTGDSLSAGSFVSGEKVKALDADDFILYDTASGKLYYDADGGGSGKAVQFATLVGQPALVATDFSI